MIIATAVAILLRNEIEAQEQSNCFAKNKQYLPHERNKLDALSTKHNGPPGVCVPEMKSV